MSFCRHWHILLLFGTLLPFDHHFFLVESKEFKIGMLIFKNCCYGYFDMETSASALTIATEDLQETGILSNSTIRVLTRQAQTESSGVANVVDLVLNEDVDVIFGSPSSRVSVPSAHLTSHWNFPQISWLSTSAELSDKTRFGTYMRTTGPFSKTGIAFAKLFQKFGWKRVAFLFRDTNVCQYATNGIKHSFASLNITVAQSIGYAADVTPTMPAIDGYMQRMKKASRIVVLCDTVLLRTLMLRACRSGMCHGDYVFLVPGAKVNADFHTQQMWSTGEEDDPEAREAFRHLLYVTLASWDSERSRVRLAEFSQMVVEKMAEPPWNNDFALRTNMRANGYAPHLYNAMYFYGLWLNHTMEHDLDHRDGRAMLEFSHGMTFEGIDGTMEFDDNGDSNPLYWIWDFKEEQGFPEILASAKSSANENPITEDGWVGFRWLTAGGAVPTDTPQCGFYNEFCPPAVTDNTAIVVASGISVVALVLVAGSIVYIVRKRELEANMLKMIWKINVNEIEIRKSTMAFGSTKSYNSMAAMSTSSQTLPTEAIDAALSRTTALVRGQVATIRTITKQNLAFTRSDLVELKEMREMSHNNINPFLGACLDFPGACVLFLFCPKGSLQDILENDDIKLDTLFKYSLSSDLVEGLYFLHQSKLGSHGRLKSTNCVVDNRWVLKITDYGVARFLDVSEPEEEHQKYKSLLWTAPELLGETAGLGNGTKEGDVYSLGIILHEIFYRMGTFGGKPDMTTRDIVERVRSRDTVPCRPEIFDDTNINPAVKKLMQLCWLDSAKDRPTISTVKSYTKKNIRGVGANIVDVMLRRLETYASNLEEVVAERTKQLVEEKTKTDKLLYRMLPPSCADKLKAGEAVEPELYDAVTIFFSDVVGFTSISAQSTPLEVVNLLNDLYTLFDGIIAQFDAYKVETIGDAYLVVSGLPRRNGNRHVAVIADMSLNILAAIRGFRIQHLPDEQLMVRIGMHTGPCCAGVVGLSMPRFCLFGDAVNTASRMESNGLKQKIHLSEASSLALEAVGGYQTSLRGELAIKGKGMMSTYWLDGKVT